MNRREMLRNTAGAGLALGLSAFPKSMQTLAADGPKKRLLVYTRSQGFQHDVAAVREGKECIVDRTWKSLANKHGFDVECTKDGRAILPETLAKFDAIFFYTTGDLTADQATDKTPAMPKEGKKALLDAIANGKGFIGSHCATDTFHSPTSRFTNDDAAKIDPYISMIGAEFIRHGDQQPATMQVVDASFPGLEGVSDFKIKEEWYALKNFQPDLHVILVQKTAGMKGEDYQRPNFPATWARMHGKGRVFYTSLGHREDVWANPLFLNLLAGAASWAFGIARADLTPNMQSATPRGTELPRYPSSKK